MALLVQEGLGAALVEYVNTSLAAGLPLAPSEDVATITALQDAVRRRFVYI
jgi:uncharacterized protein with von Willebrand factor type A (vWA) domain